MRESQGRASTISNHFSGNSVVVDADASESVEGHAAAILNFDYPLLLETLGFLGTR